MGGASNDCNLVTVFENVDVSSLITSSHGFTESLRIDVISSGQCRADRCGGSATSGEFILSSASSGATCTFVSATTSDALWNHPWNNQAPYRPTCNYNQQCASSSWNPDNRAGAGTGRYSWPTRGGRCTGCERHSVCQPGYYQRVAPGRSTDRRCAPCPAGKYQHDWGQVSCRDCPKGRYAEGTGSKGQWDCTACSAGQYGDATGMQWASGCKDCNAGRYGLPFKGACANGPCENAACSGACAPGRYGNMSRSKGSIEWASDQCSGACPAGKAACCGPNLPGVPCSTGCSDCTVCAAGWYAQRQSSACKECSEGHYSPGGEGVCRVCPAGKRSSIRQATTLGQCSNCDAGQYSSSKEYLHEVGSDENIEFQGPAGYGGDAWVQWNDLVCNSHPKLTVKARRSDHRYWYETLRIMAIPTPVVTPAPGPPELLTEDFEEVGHFQAWDALLLSRDMSTAAWARNYLNYGYNGRTPSWSTGPGRAFSGSYCESSPTPHLLFHSRCFAT